VVPPELAGTVPRDVRLTASGVTIVILAIALAAGALVSAIGLSIAHVRTEDARAVRARTAVSVLAEVTGVSVRRGEHPRRIATYAYDVNGRRYTGRVELRPSEASIGRGSRLPIGVVPSRPEASWRIGREPGVLPVWPIPLASGSLLLLAAVIARSVNKQRVLLSEGRVAQARVTEQKKVRSDKHHAYRITYEFQSLSGARQTARYEVGKTPPPVGSLIPIVYHRDNPRWSAVYPLQLVRPARRRTASA
jgi:hypothetical protein